MFYMFHHIPKCGGTSFNRFLESVFDVTRDYHPPNGPKAEPEAFQEYIDRPIDLGALGNNDCISGHYNMDRIFLYDRYPDLESLPHRKFSIVREPFAAALSGVYFAMKRGRIPALTPEQIADRVLRRSRYIAKVFGVRHLDEIDEVFDRYWFIAPLERIGDAAKVIETARGLRGSPIGITNTTEKIIDVDVGDLRAVFTKRPLSTLPYSNAPPSASTPL